MRGIHIEHIIYVCKYPYLTLNIHSKVNEAKQSEKFYAKLSEYCEAKGSEYLN
jgi:hypothetical protein